MTETAAKAAINNVLEAHFDTNDGASFSFRYSLPVEWFTSKIGSVDLNTQNRAIQREKVASDEWKSEIINTIVFDNHITIPEIHISVTDDESYQFDLLDGQQRLTAITDFIGDGFSLSDDFSSEPSLSGMTFSDLKKTHSDIATKILEYPLYVVFYGNISDVDAAHLFVEILNNTNDLKPQEKRNAVRGDYSDFIRDTVRFNPSPEPNRKIHKLHDLFERRVFTSGKKRGSEELVNFPKLTLSGRMEADEWLSELCFLFLSDDWKSGVSQQAHTKWVKKIQVDEGKYHHAFKDKKKIKKLLDLALSLLNSSKNYNYLSHMTKMKVLIMTLYVNDLESQHNNVDIEEFLKGFIATEKTHNDVKAYGGKTQLNGKDMQPFKDLFGGKNENAIKTICKILDEEIKTDPVSFGLVKKDPRETFDKKDILKKWEEQGFTDYYTEEPLAEANLAGDHYIPHSWGVDKGGVTEYSNLVVTSTYHNLQKLNMSGDEYLKRIKGKAS